MTARGLPGLSRWTTGLALLLLCACGQPSADAPADGSIVVASAEPANPELHGLVAPSSVPPVEDLTPTGATPEVQPAAARKPQEAPAYAPAPAEQLPATAARGDTKPSPANTPSLPAWTWPQRRPPAEAGTQARRPVPGIPHLQWLAAHQCLDGHWDPARFAGWCEGTDRSSPPGDDAGWDQHEVGVTALATLAFLSGGFVPRGDHEFARVVRRAFVWLKAAQGRSGLVCTRSHPTWLWDHAIATLAFVELYGMTESAFWRKPAVAALEALSGARAPGAGVWTYGPRADGLDESLTLWAVLPIFVARSIERDAFRRGRPRPLEVDEPALAATLAWLERGTDPATGLLSLGQPGATAPDLPGGSPREIGALGLLVRVMDCQDPQVEGALKQGATLLTTWLPEAGATRAAQEDVLWWAGTLVSFACGRPRWEPWDDALEATVLREQIMGGDPCEERGSWAPQGEFGRLGGRVAATALMALCFSVYYRYDNQVARCPLPQPTEPQPADPK